MRPIQDPKRRSWLPCAPKTEFPIQNIPFGVMRGQDGIPHVATIIGDHVIDLFALSEMGMLDDLEISRPLFAQPGLNAMLEHGLPRMRSLRSRIAELFDEANPNRRFRERADHYLHDRERVEMMLPVQAGDYTDFYSSRQHAEAVGELFRGPGQALPPNWLHMPLAYHGRSSSIQVSGNPIRRPCGPFLPEGSDKPVFGPSRKLDFELETAFVIGKPSTWGSPVPLGEAEDHIFGLLLFNDWSARDIQRWEYKPLGPFLGKNFASTVSPWIVTLDALQEFRTDGPTQDDPLPLPYLRESGPRQWDIQLEVSLRCRGAEEVCICRGNTRFLYWSISQQLAHHTVNGCNVRVGDLLASGTISGPAPDGAGSLLEITRDGKEPLRLGRGLSRSYLEDGDSIRLRGWAENENYRIGFGMAEGSVLPAREVS